MLLIKQLKNIPEELVQNLEKEFQKLHKHYFLEMWEPSQLNAGKFSEIILRMLEFYNEGAYTPLNKQINRHKITASVKKNITLKESLRFQICSLSEILLDFRNKRNVAHIGSIDVSKMDATFVMNAVNWIMAEIVRLETKMPSEKAEDEIAKIIDRKIPIIEDINGRPKVLNPKLTAKEQILLICYRMYPNHIHSEKLFKLVYEKNKTRYKQYLSNLDKKRLIDYFNEKVQLTKRGMRWVEINIKFDLEI